MDTCKECGHNHPPEGNHLPMDLTAFKRKYGTRTLGLLVGRFIEAAPAFPQEKVLAEAIGIMIADLEWALEHHKE